MQQQGIDGMTEKQQSDEEMLDPSSSARGSYSNESRKHSSGQQERHIFREVVSVRT